MDIHLVIETLINYNTVHLFAFLFEKKEETRFDDLGSPI